jgi:hypothetical protein
MKLYVLFLALGSVMQTVTAMGQSAPAPVTVVNAPTIDTALSGLDAKISQLLETANKQLETADKQLKALGDPDAPPSAGLQSALDSGASSLGKPTVELEDNATRALAFQALTGSEVFDDNAFGTMTAIGETITRRDGTVVQRDAEKYKMDSAVMKQITDYNTARDAALTRKKELQEAIQLLTEQMNETKDLVSISKLSTMITALNGQVQDCNQIILVSQADAEMMEKEMLTTSRIITKGEREKKVEFNKRAAPAAGTGGTTTRTPVVVGDPNKGLTGATPGAANTTSSFAPNLKWGTYNTKPPADSAGTGTADP